MMILEACMYTCLSIHMHTIYSGTHTDIIWHKHAYILLHPHTLACVPTDEHMSLHSCMHMSPHVSLQMHVLQMHACGEAHTCISTGTLTSSWPFLEMCVLLCRHMHTSPNTQTGMLSMKLQANTCFLIDMLLTGTCMLAGTCTHTC